MPPCVCVLGMAPSKVCVPGMWSNQLTVWCVCVSATDCVGYIATAVGREMFTPQLATVTHHAIQGLALNHAELTEYAAFQPRREVWCSVVWGGS